MQFSNQHTVTTIRRILFTVSAVMILGLPGCAPKSTPDSALDPRTCEGCHTNKELLQELATDKREAVEADYAGGSDSTLATAWEKVYIDPGAGFSGFRDLDPTHGDIGCQNCHGGTEPSDFYGAHDPGEGFIRDPSEFPETYCTPCHGEKATGFVNSMHYQTWGIKTALAQRQLGADKDHRNFDECPVEITDGYDRECSTCHATCGQCHLSRPTVAGGGLLNSHRFAAVPDPENTCEVCHQQRQVTELSGALHGNNPDVHEAQGMDCLSCHNEDFHRDASTEKSIYNLTDLARCLNCHADADTANVFHQTHWPDGTSYTNSLDCQVCHAQSYTSCSGCHTDGEWINDGFFTSDSSFKLGLNPDQAVKPEVKWVTLRHVPVTPETYTPWGLATLAEFDSRPTWNHTSPHTINRWTTRTDTTGGGACSDRCHYHANLTIGDPVNKDLFLTRSFIQENYPAEETANDSVIVENGSCGATCHENW
ncbi:MAG: cytochrome c3 family protein [Fidelibacterota bacterium]